MMINAWDGLPLSTCRFEASGRTEAHAIVVDTILVWSGGKSSVDIDCAGRAYSVQRLSGMVDFLPAGVVLDGVRWQGQPTDCIAVVLPPAQLEALGVQRPQLEPERSLRVGATDAHVVDLVRRLHARACSEDSSDSPYVRGLSLTLASYVYSHFAADRPSSAAPGTGLSASQRQRLVAHIDARLAEPIQMGELAREVGYSQDHFLRLFSSSFGVSPHRYVTARRIERAKSMLEDPQCSLVEVAFACGFSSQAHFSTVFKLHAGVSPGRYRNHGLTPQERRARNQPAASNTEALHEDAADTPSPPRARIAIPSALRGTCPATLGSLVTAQAR
jgi:AraC family transcriptional regulator